MDFLRNWMEDRIEDSVTEGRRGNYKPGFVESIGGALTGVNAQGVADDLKTSDDKREADKYLTSIGETTESLGLSGDTYTLQDVKGAFTKTTRTRDETEKKDNRAFITSQTELSQKPVLDQLKETAKTNAGQLELARNTLKQQGEKADKQLQLTIQQGNQQMQLTSAQMAQANNQFLMQMADTKDQRAAELEVRKMEMDREDLRYNENLDRQDRKDRKANIAALVQGIASLGAAFAM